MVDCWLTGSLRRRCFQSGLASMIMFFPTKVRNSSIKSLNLITGRCIRYVHPRRIHSLLSPLRLFITSAYIVAAHQLPVFPPAPHRRRAKLPPPKRPPRQPRTQATQKLTPGEVHPLLERPSRHPRRPLRLQVPRDVSLPLRRPQPLQ